MPDPKPIAYRVCFIEPFVPSGQTASGIFIEHHHKLPAIFGRVTAVAPTCRLVRVGDWVTFLPKRPHRLRYRGADLFAISEERIHAVIDPGDGSPWFVADPQTDLGRRVTNPQVLGKGATETTGRR